MMHIGHNNVQGNYNMSNQQLPTTDQQLDLWIIVTKDLKWQTETLVNGNTLINSPINSSQQSTGVHCPQFNVHKQKNRSSHRTKP